MREVRVSRAAFRHPDVVERARLDYDQLAMTTRIDETLNIVFSLVDEIVFE